MVCDAGRGVTPGVGVGVTVGVMPGVGVGVIPGVGETLGVGDAPPPNTVWLLMPLLEAKTVSEA
jgi:hypothetical protein